MTIDEAIVHAREVAECRDDMCAECRVEHEQLADWLEELKSYKELDLEIPQHFTKEQSAWIKKYCVEKNKEFYNNAIDDIYAKAKEIQLEQIKNLEQSSTRSGKMWARYMNTYLGHIEIACKRLLKDGVENDD